MGARCGLEDALCAARRCLAQLRRASAALAEARVKTRAQLAPGAEAGAITPPQREPAPAGDSNNDGNAVHTVSAGTHSEPAWVPAERVRAAWSRVGALQLELERLRDARAMCGCCSPQQSKGQGSGTAID
jgi:hypothetical protein